MDKVHRDKFGSNPLCKIEVDEYFIMIITIKTSLTTTFDPYNETEDWWNSLFYDWKFLKNNCYYYIE